jgi:O-antigen ligase
MLFIAKWRGWRRYAAMLTAAVLVWGIVISGSRAGALGAATVLLLSLAVFRHHSMAGPALIGGIVGALLLAGLHPRLPALNAVNRLVDRNSASVVQSDITRAAAVDDAVVAIQRHPLTGVGFDEAEAAHNIYLQTWASGGILALTGFLVVAWATVKPLRVAARRAHEHRYEEEVVAIGISLGFAGYLVAGFFQNAMWERYVWLMPALVAAAWALKHESLEWGTSSYRRRERSLQRLAGDVGG